MKITKKITTLTVCYILASTNILHSKFDDSFDDEFFTSMTQLEKQFEESTNHMRSAFKQFHDKFFSEDFTTQSKNFELYDQQPNLATPQNGIISYQQHSNTLSFGNNDKTIKIIEQTDNATAKYTIIVTEKSANNITQSHDSDVAAEIKSLQLYIKNNFNAKSADLLLQKCMNAMTEENKNQIININATIHENQKTYTIEIAHKKEEFRQNDQPQTSRKNKKAKFHS